MHLPSTMEVNYNYPLIRRSVTQRNSIRASKRLMRSASGLSPLARSLLISLHEQKRAALAEQRARRWELYSVVNQQLRTEYAISNTSKERCLKDATEGNCKVSEESYCKKSEESFYKDDEGSHYKDSEETYCKDAEEDQVVPNLLPTITQDTDTSQNQPSKKKGLMRLRSMKKHVSKAMNRIFARKSDKHQVEEPSGFDTSNIRSFRRYPVTELWALVGVV